MRLRQSSYRTANEEADCGFDIGPGYRIYIGQDGKTLVILLGGGTKKGQNADIQLAQQRWREYKARKKR
ncbi:MAG: hypothetical protein WB402_06530 [Sulfuricaulis sp.]|uniref:hypothetical protein n=1 Tax=Sulfuricaulis sp. TaxID=2003553 RepID=UPI003C544ACC